MATQIPDQLKYTKDHDWAIIEGDIVTLGISDYAQSQLGEIVFVELPEVNTTFEKDSSFGVVESVKSVTDLHTPVSGEIIEVNSQLSDSPELCNSAPYESWMIKIKMSSPDEANKLLNCQEYKKHCEDS